MSHDPHHHGDAAGVEVHVLVASSTRTAEDDGDGPALEAALAAFGHTVGSTSVVDDDQGLLREQVKRLVGKGVGAVIVAGGTGFSARDVSPEAVEPMFQRRIDGFGELFRTLSFQEVGPKAMLSRASAGVIGTTAVFLIPGNPAAAKVAADLLGPVLGHLVGLLRRPEAPPRPIGEITEEVALEPAPSRTATPAPAPEALPQARALSKAGVAVVHREDAPTAAPASEGPWQRRVRELEGTVIRGGEREPFPEEVERLAPLVDLLVGAGDVAVLAAPDGRRWSLWGFPDLRRANSKVLALREGLPLCELVALHRVGTGTCVEGPEGLVTSRGQPADTVTEAIVGRACPAGGALFAVTGDAVYLERDVGGSTRVFRWDGHKEAVLGTPRQALVTLALDWARR